MWTEPEPTAAAPRRALIALAVASALLFGVGAAYVARRAASIREPRDTAIQPIDGARAGAIASVRARPHLVVLEPQTHGRPRIAFAPLDDLERGRVATAIEAERVYAAGRRLVCLGSTAA